MLVMATTISSHTEREVTLRLKAVTETYTKNCTEQREIWGPR